MRSDVLAQLQSPVNNKELIPAHACSIQGLEERAWERTGPGGGTLTVQVMPLCSCVQLHLAARICSIPVDGGSIGHLLQMKYTACVHWRVQERMCTIWSKTKRLKSSAYGSRGSNRTRRASRGGLTFPFPHTRRHAHNCTAIRRSP